MAGPAQTLFDSLTTYASVQGLIDAGEAEGQYLECKAPTSPQFTRDMRAKLAEAASGFANSGGGVILWGVGTDKHNSLDVLTQIQPIGNIKRLAQQIDRSLPGLTMPRLALQPSRMLYPSKEATKGIIVTYIPPSPGDPVQSVVDRKFYFRSGDEFHEMPYDVLKRMFVGAEGPLLRPLFDPRLVKIDEKNVWNVPIVLANDSTTAAKDTSIAVFILNPGACISVGSTGELHNRSDLNPGQTIFIAPVGTIFRGMNKVVGSLLVQMKKGQRPKRVLNLQIQIFSDRMRARQWTFKVQLARKGFSIKNVEDQFLY